MINFQEAEEPPLRLRPGSIKANNSTNITN